MQFYFGTQLINLSINIIRLGLYGDQQVAGADFVCIKFLFQGSQHLSVDTPFFKQTYQFAATGGDTVKLGREMVGSNVGKRSVRIH